MFAMESPRTFFNAARADGGPFYDQQYAFPPPPAAAAGTSQQPGQRSPNASPDSFAHDYDRRPAQYALGGPQFAAGNAQGLGAYYPHQQPQLHAQHAWAASTKLELTDDGSHALLAQDQRSHSSASSSPGLPQHMAPAGGYHTTPSPPPQGQQQKTFAFIALPGNAVRKRPRRRYDEIERLYPCNWPNCNKSYGTLNHLNAHVTMQRHGEKRSPNEFKEMRKQWRKQKKEEAALAQMQMQHASLAGVHGGGITPPRRGPGDLHSPMSLGFPSPTEYSPIDGEHGMFPGGGMPRRMSLPNLAMSGLGLDVSPPPLPPMPSHFSGGGMALPSLQLAPIPPADFWMQQQQPHQHHQQPLSAPPQHVNYLPEALHMPQQRLAHDSTLLTPLQRGDD